MCSKLCEAHEMTVCSLRAVHRSLHWNKVIFKSASFPLGLIHQHCRRKQQPCFHTLLTNSFSFCSQHTSTARTRMRRSAKRTITHTLLFSYSRSTSIAKTRRRRSTGNTRGRSTTSTHTLFSLIFAAQAQQGQEGEEAQEAQEGEAPQALLLVIGLGLIVPFLCTCTKNVNE